jgi:Polysaccharide lyase
MTGRPLLLSFAILAAFSSVPSLAASGAHKPNKPKRIPAGFGHAAPPWQIDDYNAAKGNPPDVRTIAGPVGGIRDSLALTATSTSNGVSPSQSPDSDMTDVWLETDKAGGAFAGAPQTTWYRTHVYFPRDYRATPGDWNFFQVWHLDDRTGQDSGGVARSPGFDVDTCCGAPRIKLRWASGANRSPTLYNWFDRRPLKLAHWYDELVRVTWSCDPQLGRVQWWQDGALLIDRTMQTLYTRSDGSCGFVGFGLYNYRLHMSWISTIYFGAVRIGPTRVSVR